MTVRAYVEQVAVGDALHGNAAVPEGRRPRARRSRINL